MNHLSCFLRKILTSSIHSREWVLQWIQWVWWWNVRFLFLRLLVRLGKRFGTKGFLSTWSPRCWPALVTLTGNPPANAKQAGSVGLSTFYKLRQETEAWGVEINLPKVTQLALFIYSLPRSKKDFSQCSHTVRKFLVVSLPSQEKQGRIFFLFKLKWCIVFQSILLHGRLPSLNCTKVLMYVSVGMCGRKKGNCWIWFHKVMSFT